MKYQLYIYKFKRTFLFTCLLFFSAAPLFAAKAGNSFLSPEQQNASQSFPFEENLGQFKRSTEFNSPAILFKAHFSGNDIYVTEKGLTYLFINAKQKSKITASSLDSTIYAYTRFDIDLKGASILKTNCLKENASPENYNFFFAHCPKGITAVKRYKKIIIKNVYEGIDWVIYDAGKQGLKYDFIVHKNADPKQIILLYKTLNPVSINNGNISLSFDQGSFSEHAPISFLSDSKKNIPGKFELLKTNKKDYQNNIFYETEIGFNIQAYDKNEELTIDPLQHWWGTYFGGSLLSVGTSISTDPSGNVFVLGDTQSIDLPLQPYGSLAYFQNNLGLTSIYRDPFILKFTNTGQLLWATYFGGTQADYARAIKCDSTGNVFITGSSYSSDFPLKNAGGNCYFNDLTGLPPSLNVFISKFSNDGEYLWGTFYGSQDDEEPYAMDIDAYNNIYIAGSTSSTNFPVYSAGNGTFFQTGLAGAYTADGFILKFSNTGQRLLATYFGGNGTDLFSCVACDPFGNVFFSGNTSSTNLYVLNPGSGAFFQPGFTSWVGSSIGFVLKLNASCQAVWSTYLGGNNAGGFRSIACDKQGNVFVAGGSSSSVFPTVDPGGGAYYQSTNNNNQSRIVLVKFNAQSQMTWSTFLGNSNLGLINLAVGKCDEIYLSHCEIAVCSTCGISPTVNPGNGAYFNGTCGDISYPTFNDIFIAGFSNSGICRWGTYFGGSKEDLSMVMTTDKYGNIFYTGEQGSLQYYTQADFQTYATNCLLDPGNGAFFQPSVLGTPGIKAYCVIGKFISPQVNSTFTTTGCGNSNSASIQAINGMGPYTYNWSNGSAIQTINNVTPGMYSYTITDNFFGCKETGNIYLGPPSLNLNVSSASTAICPGHSLTLNVSGANSFSWAPATGLNSISGNVVNASPGVTTIYTLTASNLPGCNADTVITITVNPLPVITISGKDSLCSGSSNLFRALGASNYLWSSLSATIANTPTIMVSPIQDQSYTVIGTDNNGCIDSTSLHVKVIQSPQLQVSGSLSVCPGNSSTITASGADDFTWLSVSGSLSGSQFITSPVSNTSYTLTGTNQKFCSDSISFSITVFPIPSLSMISPDSACTDIDFKLQANGNGRFEWLGQAVFDCTQCPDPTVKVNGPTELFVTMTDKNSCKIKDSVFVNITHACDFELTIPDIFTPNGDDANDVFKLESKGISQLNCSIFNRWGTLLYFFDKVHGFWDGRTTSGLECPDGVYFYVIDVVDLRSKNHKFNGPLSLIR